MDEPKWKIEACRTCDAAIIWARTPVGNAIRVNAAPVDNGNLKLEMRQGYVRVTVDPVKRDGEARRTPHPPTCQAKGKGRG